MLVMVFVLLPEPAFALEANTLEAEVEGVPITFYLEKAVIQDWGKLNATYVSYNPRGEKEYRLWISLPPSIEPGVYDFSEPGSNFTLSTQYYQSRNRWGVDYDTSYAKGSGSFAITERNDSWTHYTGTFDLSMHFTVSYPNKTVQGSFDFTLGKCFQIPEPTGADIVPNVESVLPVAEPADDTPQAEWNRQVAGNKAEENTSIPGNETFSIPEPSETTSVLSEAPTISSSEPFGGMHTDVTPQVKAPKAKNSVEGFSEPFLSSSEEEKLDTYAESVFATEQEKSDFISFIFDVGGIFMLIAVAVYMISKAHKKRKS